MVFNEIYFIYYIIIAIVFGVYFELIFIISIYQFFKPFRTRIIRPIFDPDNIYSDYWDEKSWYIHQLNPSFVDEIDTEQ